MSALAAAGRPDSSFAYLLVKVTVHNEHVPVWHPDKTDFNALDTPAHVDTWDAHLVLQSGWLYWQDVHMCELAPERGAVLHYVATIDTIDRLQYLLRQEFTLLDAISIHPQQHCVQSCLLLAVWPA
jgi:hypothetical protein